VKPIVEFQHGFRIVGHGQLLPAVVRGIKCIALFANSGD
jgi:hypothetical protein